MQRQVAVALLALFSVGCGGAQAASRWSGTVDTLPDGVIEVKNPDRGIWDSSDAWHVVEDLRVGTLEGTGPDLFGDVGAVEVDAAGRIWVLEDQAQEIRVFDRDGRYVRTVGRKGGGPGEFAGATGLVRDPVGRMWVYDGQNNRISVIDTAGNFVTSHRAIGSFTISPFPGIFDRDGHFYTYFVDQDGGQFAWAFIRNDTAMTPLDTVIPPRDMDEREYFEIRSANSWSRSTVPYSPRMQWSLTPSGDFWMVRTGRYELTYRTAAGDTLRRVTRAYDPLPVTPEDMDSVRARFADWIERGATIDFSRVPKTKPAVSDIYVDDGDHVWVEREPAVASDRHRLFDIFDPEGRFLGQVRLPFAIQGAKPVFRGGYLYAATTDDLEVPYVVRARIVRPTA